MIVMDSQFHNLPATQIVDFCKKWHVVELALFGSAARGELTPQSDVDVLVTFAPNAPVSLWDWGAMMDELSSIFGRPVDLVEKSAIRNPFKRNHILSNHRVLYAA